MCNNSSRTLKTYNDCDYSKCQPHDHSLCKWEEVEYPLGLFLKDYTDIANTNLAWSPDSSIHVSREEERMYTIDHSVTLPRASCIARCTLWWNHPSTVHTPRWRRRFSLSLGWSYWDLSVQTLQQPANSQFMICLFTQKHTMIYLAI